MIKALVNFATNRYSDADLTVKSNTIVTSMTGNAAFTNPSPALDVVQAASDDFLTSEQKAEGGSHQDVALKNQKRKVLEKQLHDLGVYVNQTANGDIALLMSSGFDLSKSPEPIGPLDAPDNLKLKPGKSKGTLEASWNTVGGANTYGVEYRLLNSESSKDWVRIDSTKHQVLVSGLTSGSQYAFRVVAIGSNAQRNWSDEVYSYVM